MEDIFFCYDHGQGSWQEAARPAFNLAETAGLPVVLIVSYYHEFSGEKWKKAWCPEHQAYEEIAAFTADGLVTEKGCKLTGLTALVPYARYQFYYNHEEPIAATLLWQVGKRDDDQWLAYEYKAETAFDLPRFSFWEKLPPVPHLLKISKKMYSLETDTGRPLPESLVRVAFPELRPRSGEAEDRKPALDIELELRKEENYYRRELWDSQLLRPSWECRINGYDFRQLHSFEGFCNIRKHYNVYWPGKEELQDKIYFGVERNGRYLGLVTLEGEVIQYIDYPCERDDISVARLRIAVLAWMRQMGLAEKHSSRQEDCQLALEQDFNIGPLEDSPWENMSLRQMLSLSEAETGRGYYLQLYRKLYATPIWADSKLPPDDEEEMAYFHEHWPCGGRIFVAAERGEPEAQYVMHLLYSDGYCFNRRDYRRSGAWYGLAVKNGWRKLVQEQENIRLMGFKLPVSGIE